MTDWETPDSQYERYKSESFEWGISFGERFELEALCRSNLKRLDKFDDDDWVDLNFRIQVAETLSENGLGKKAHRYLMCSRQAFVLRCQGDAHHEFFSPSYCDLRFCRFCSKRQFARLFAKHSSVLEFIRRNPRRAFRLRQITLTSRNTGILIHENIKIFNAAVKEALNLLMNGVKGWGAIAVLEIGFNNSNLHAHILAWCPYIEQSRLAKVWRQVSGHEVVWISEERVSGRKALLYMLKYVSKPPSDRPQIIGQLEVAFHKTRRVHCYGLFYNFNGDEEDGDRREWMECPKCGAEMKRVKGIRFVFQLRRQGLQLIGNFRQQRKNKSWVN
ncbi:MAG TPA: protein rep [Candidatus Acidoferrales bacterium]